MDLQQYGRESVVSVPSLSSFEDSGSSHRSRLIRNVYTAYRSYRSDLFDRGVVPLVTSAASCIIAHAAYAARDLEMLDAYYRRRMPRQNYAMWVQLFPPISGVKYHIDSQEYIEDVARCAAEAIHMARYVNV